MGTTSSLPRSQLGSGNNQLFTKVTNGQSEQLPPYQVDNWLVRTTTSLPSSQLVSQNNQLCAKFKTGQSKPPLLYQAHNWLVRTTTTSLPSSQLVSQNHHLFTKLRTGYLNNYIFTKFTTGQPEVRPAARQQNSRRRHAHRTAPWGLTCGRWTDSGGKV